MTLRGRLESRTCGLTQSWGVPRVWLSAQRSIISGRSSWLPMFRGDTRRGSQRISTVTRLVERRAMLLARIFSTLGITRFLHL